MRRKTVALASDADRADRRFLSRTTHPQICRRELAPIYSNRSASFLRLSKVSQALSDAERCIELRPDWDKAYFRKATALEAQNDDDAALVQFEVRKAFFWSHRLVNIPRRAGSRDRVAFSFVFSRERTDADRPFRRERRERTNTFVRRSTKQEALRVASEDQSGMLEQKIRLCKQRVARAKRAEHHQPKKAHGEKEVAGKVRDKGSGFKFAGAAVQAQNKMKTLVKDAVAAAPEEKQEPKAPAPVAGEGADKNAEAETQKKAAEEQAAAAAKAAAEKKAAEEKAAAVAAESGDRRGAMAHGRLSGMIPAPIEETTGPESTEIESDAQTPDGTGTPQRRGTTPLNQPLGLLGAVETSFARGWQVWMESPISTAGKELWEATAAATSATAASAANAARQAADRDWFPSPFGRGEEEGQGVVKDEQGATGPGAGPWTPMRIQLDWAGNIQALGEFASPAMVLFSGAGPEGDASAAKGSL